MSEFQTVKRRGHSQNANAKYPEQHQQLVEMGFESSSVSRALDASNGDMEAATAVLIGEGSHKNETEEKVVPASKERKAAASTAAPAASTSAASAAAPKTARQSNGLAVVAAGQSVKDIKETHQRMIATYKVQKCKETGAHDRKMCMNYHSLSDRRRNPFETLYSCYECPNTVDGGECPDGDSCMHSHTMLERMFHPELYKISVCQRQLTGNKCDRAMLCAFAHNDADLRISPSHLTTKYAMQEEAKTTPVPVNQSAMLDHIRSNLVKLIKEHGSEGVIAADLPKYYQGKFHESLDLIDESGKKYKLKDLIGPHNNIHVVLTGQPKFVFGDPSIAAAAAESQAAVPTPSTTPRETSQTSSTTAASSQTVKDRVVELIKAAGAEGILATDMSKKYQERYGEKLEKDWNVGLNAVAGMVLTQTKQYTKYTFNAITAGIKDAAIPSAVATKDAKSVSNSGSAASSKAAVASVPASAPAHPTTASQSAPKWGSNTGKSFASILSAQGAAAAAAAASTPAVVEAVVEAPKAAPVEAATVPTIEPKTAVTSPTPTTAQKASKTEKAANEKTSKATNGAKLETKTSQSSETSEKDTPVETVAATPAPLAISDNSVVGASLTTVSSPSSSVGLVLGASPSVSRGTSDMGTLPKPLFGGLDSQLNGTGLDNQFSLGLGSGGSSSLLDLASASLTGILPSSFDLPLDGMDLGGNSVLPPGLSKAIGKPTGVSGGAPSLSSILGQSLSGSNGLGGLPLTSSSRDTPERNVSSGTVNNGVANSGTMTQAERVAYLERELAAKTQEADAHAAEVSVLRSRVNDLEAMQLNHDERLRSSIMEKDMELLTKHQEIVKYEDELRKSKEEKLVDLDQYFIYFSKIEEVINAMKCKEEAFSEKIKPEDVQELFQFKKLMRNYVANVKAQLKNKFDVVVAQTQLMRGSSGNAVVKDPSVEAVALGMVLPSGPPPGGLNTSTSGVSSAGSATSSASTGVFGVLSSGASATGVTSTGTSRFAGSFDTHSMPFAHNHHHGLTNVGDAFSSSSVLFPTVTDLGVATTTASVVTKQCGLPGCLKEGLYTCAGCRKISYCGEAHQR